ncbi:MAG: ABC transporter ATP-binding protein [Chitinophagaceae bacterium]
MFCLSTTELTHHFSGNEIALNNINMQVPEGSIYGFLGPNGAGKTTTLRLILGLLKKQKGTIEVFGKPFAANRIEILRKVGSLIESPSIYGHLTANENLLVLQKIYQCPKHRIEEVLKLVDLPNTGNKKASRFSLGMKQRLSIAIALLNNPRLLILDEPTNGLDPGGIIEMRELLRKLNYEEGTTILISSHLLAEIEKLVTDVGIIHKGKLLFQGTLTDLINKQQEASCIVLDTNEPAKALQILLSLQLDASIDKEKIVLPIVPKHTIAAINKQLVNAGIEVYGIGVGKNDLESVFVELVNK